MSRREKAPRPGRGAFRRAAPTDHAGAPEVVAALQASPGEWFIVEEGAPRSLLGFGLNYAWLKDRPGYELDVREGLPGQPAVTAAMVSRMGIVTVYARYVGEAPAEASAAAEAQPADLRKVTDAHRPENPSC